MWRELETELRQSPRATAPVLDPTRTAWRLARSDCGNTAEPEQSFEMVGSGSTKFGRFSPFAATRPRQNDEKVLVPRGDNSGVLRRHLQSGSLLRF